MNNDELVPLPDGWTIERVREVAQASVAEVLEPPPAAWYEVRQPDGATQTQPIEAETVLSVGGYFLVQERGELEAWNIASRDEDGRIVCWATYDDLGAALRGL